MPTQKTQGARFSQGLVDEKQILRELGLRPGQVVVDAGCGHGYMSKNFSAAVGPAGKVYALDKDHYFLGLLEAEAQEDNIQTIQADITSAIPLGDSSADLLYISTVLHIFSPRQMQGFVREARRLLKPGALLAAVEIDKKETPFGPPLKFRHSPQELRELIPMAPFKTVRAGEHFYLQIFRNLPPEGEGLA